MVAVSASKYATREQAEAFLYHEVRLLDEGDLEKWAELFTDDGIYWMPLGAGKDHATEPAILCDNAQNRAMRVRQLMHYTHLAQDPPSRLIHFISNVEVEDTSVAEEVLVRCNTLIHELRPGDFQALQIGLGNQRAIAARCEYRLRRPGDWRIAEKKILLINRDLPVSNLTCVL